MSESIENTIVDIKQIHVTTDQSVRIVLEHKVIDEYDLKISSTMHRLFFEKNADVSDQSPMIQKICNDAWAA
jgi:hypothetical protein